jgi:hypothetical protein
MTERRLTHTQKAFADDRVGRFDGCVSVCVSVTGVSKVAADLVSHGRHSMTGDTFEHDEF